MAFDREIESFGMFRKVPWRMPGALRHDGVSPFGRRRQRIPSRENSGAVFSSRSSVVRAWR